MRPTFDINDWRFDCWCGQPHQVDPTTPIEAGRNLTHSVLSLLRIPELADWLKRRLR